jgi:hypothetical protein
MAEPAQGIGILARQLAEFGAILRSIAPGLHRSWDTFYRKHILLAFHPGGAVPRRERESARTRSRDCAGGVLPEIQMTEDG